MTCAPTLDLEEQENATAERNEYQDRYIRSGLFDPTFHADVTAQLRSLEALESGWDGYGAAAVDSAVARAALAFILRLPHWLAARPHVAPLSNGSLQFEWRSVGRALEFEFESPNHIRYLRWEPQAAVEDEGVISVDDSQSANALISWFLQGA